MIRIDLLREIGMIARALDSISNIEFKAHNLTKGQYLYLVRIFENPGIIQEKLAEMIKVDRATASRALKKLEINGFIEKKSDAHNQKIKRLYSSEKGNEIYPILLREHIHSNNVALAGLSPDEIDMTLRLVQKIRQNVESDWNDVKKGHKRNY